MVSGWRIRVDLEKDTKNAVRPVRTLRPDGPVSARVDEVPGPGIEPGTRGFSVPCSTS